MNIFKPISVLLGVSRLFEKIFHDQLFEFLTANNLVSRNQFTQRKLHSMNMSLLNVSDNWYNNVDEERINVSLLLDLGKVFDTIDHDLLLTKLGKYGIIQKELTWFTSYITSCTQYCYRGGKISEKTGSYLRYCTRVMFGAPSVNSFTNDFEKSLSAFHPNMYTDGTSILSTNENSLQV